MSSVTDKLKNAKVSEVKRLLNAASREAQLVYYAEPTPARFHACDKFIRGIMGPVRSGKSTACSAEIMRRAQEQHPCTSDGVSRTRWAAVRNTYRELEDTTLKTWLMWFGKMGRFNRQQMTWTAEYPNFHMEVLFRALDTADDIRKLLSLELTGAWVNEAREVPKGIIDGLSDRVGQYPRKGDGGCTWAGLIMDTNPPDSDHWWYHLAEEETPEDWAFFRQPGALLEVDGKFHFNPVAENIRNLNEGKNYYLKRVGGKSKDHIRVYYCGNYGFVLDGKPVIPEYVDGVHYQPNAIYVPGLKVIVGIDFGLTPAAVFAQQLPTGHWQWIDELVTESMGAVRFSEELKIKIARDFPPGAEFEFWGDPAGEQRAQTDEKTPFQILNADGIKASPAIARVDAPNDATIRREAIAQPLSRLVDGKPGLVIGPKCPITRKGLAGGYKYRRLKVSGDERYEDKPNKNKYSHPVEAGGYAMVGGGEGRRVLQSRESDDSNVMSATQMVRLYRRG